MFNAEFFPSTDAVIETMLQPWLAQPRDTSRGMRGYHESALMNMTICDPQAGSGKILDWIEEHLRRTHNGHWSSYSKNLYACEIDQELKAMLQGKNYKVIADDFLGYEGGHQFDLLVMNPPFSCADKHILHAFKTVAPGGHVVTILNSETIRNPFTETRQLLAKLIADHGSVEELGQVFLAEEAERKTDVHVSLVRLQRPAERDPLDFDFHSGKRGRTHSGPELTEDTFADAVALQDVIGNMMVGYEQAQEAFVDYMRARRTLQFYGSQLVSYQQDILDVANEAIKSSPNKRAVYNEFCDNLNQSAWHVVLDKVNIQKYMTNQVRKDFERYGRAQGYMQFCKENVASLVEMVFENRTTILDKAVVAVFDIFTSYHKENRVHVEGWKSNDKFKANRKLVLPNWVRWDDWSTARDLKTYGSRFNINSHCGSHYSDIDKVMCYLTGENYDTCYTIERALKTRFDRLGKVYPGSSFDNDCESQFFNLRFFKKGTLHIEFKEEMLWQEFNLRACAGKQWLPEPEMKAYQQRQRSPYDPAPVAPEPQTVPGPVLLALEAAAVVAEEEAPAGTVQRAPAEQSATVRRLTGPGKQLSWLDQAA
ncbi:class I SAM-dependent methyltransferase [Hymenobacter mucosus]|uniref:DUF4942 domain-containing protein n=1 Tax=Hymenobacter mucosus TaxID=1411120 RepID=A0A239A544_9BACT|nr:DUF4942 domain-containing protein [Hymenobacter mucosus]SNR90154.1 protein of unknown function [Hymenobacter mucosus]